MSEGTLAGHGAAWRTWGDGARRALALHCALAHSGAWAGFAAASPGLTLTALDLPGHGRSADWDGNGDYHALATAMAADLLSRSPAPVTVIGHSLGGTVALRLALERPRALSRLVLIEPVLFHAAGPEAKAAHLAEHAPFAAMLARDPAEAAAYFQSIWGAGAAFADLPEPQRRYITDRIHLIAAPDDALTDDRAGLLAPGRLEALTVPVLLIRGERSPPVIAAIHETLARRLPDVAEVVVPGAGHMAPITHPAECAAALA